MVVASAGKTLREATGTAEEFTDWLNGHPAAVSYALADPILWVPGWRTHLPSECVPGLRLGRRGQVDYALFDREGDMAVLTETGATYAGRVQDRNRSADRLRGMTCGLPVLTYGWYWEVYDLSLRSRRFDGKRVEELTLDPEPPEHRERVARALHG